MSRMVSGRPRRREGRGLGEMLSESAVFIMMAVGLVAAGYWYFMVYLKSPQVALQGFLGAVNSGNADAQYSYLAESTKQMVGSKENYANKYPLAHGLAARMASFSIKNQTQNGDTWSADATLNLRKSTSDLLNTATDTYTDHYVLEKASDGWKVVLEKSKIDLSKARGASQ